MPRSHGGHTVSLDAAASVERLLVSVGRERIESRLSQRTSSSETEKALGQRSTLGDGDGGTVHRKGKLGEQRGRLVVGGRFRRWPTVRARSMDDFP